MTTTTAPNAPLLRTRKTWLPRRRVVRVASIAAVRNIEEVEYPISDGEPMAESDIHWGATVYAKHSIDLHFAARAHEVYVASDNFFYWEQGNPRAVTSPDVYVVFGVPGHLRDCYKVWEEEVPATPAFVLEITSRSTRGNDMGKKFDTYEKTLRVPEYFLFDPTRDYLSGRLTGYRLVGRKYAGVEPDARGRFYSEQLKLELFVENGDLRICDPATGRVFPTMEESDAAARREAQRASVEAQRADTAEAEIARLRAQLAAVTTASVSLA